ncbi:oligosaccharide flippase family protein [Flagellimonas lutimaris]|uniref:oligosaccharide flippase family protein n=1 Tax=Flagellimonas lutimaris TaxID=475082 RepID=UPI003F5CDD50
MRIFQNKKFKQASALYIASIGAMFLGFVISVLNTRYLGKDVYGDYKFIEVLFSFTLLFSTMGFFNTGTYLVANEKSDFVQKKIIGSSLILVLFSSIVLALILLGYVFFFYEGNLREYILPLILFAPAIVLNHNLENLLQGLNKIYWLSVLKIGPKILFILSLIFLMYNSFSLMYVLILFYGSIAVITVYITFKIKFKFDLETTKQLLHHNRDVGFPIFIGALFGVASGHLSSLLVSHFNNNTDFGFFVLSLTISAPIGVMPTIIGSTMMKDFVVLNKIPAKVVKSATALSIGALVGFLLILEPFVYFFYTEQYEPVIPLAYITAFGFLMHGFGDLFIKFLYAKGQGKNMRISTMGVGIITLIASMALIPSFGAIGASIAKVVSSTSYFALVYFFYARSIKYQDRC